MSDDMDMIKAKRLLKLHDICDECKKCKLHTTRKNVVFGEGNVSADIVFVGESSGKIEDETGRPFVGSSGQLLEKMIKRSMGLCRSDIFLTNLTHCRPTKDMAGQVDRPPDQEEIEACQKYLMLQLAIIEPKIVITVGGVATQFMLNQAIKITQVHGQIFQGASFLVAPILHPSYILRNGGELSREYSDTCLDLLDIRNKYVEITGHEPNNELLECE